MGIYSNLFPMGLGTNRLPLNVPNDIDGFEQSVVLVENALAAGVNYIDTSYTYSSSMAQTVLKEAFAQTSLPFYVTAKVMYGEDKTADDARKRIETQLSTMGLDSVAYFVCWTIEEYLTFEKMMEKGGIYEGALRLKDEGIVKHICFTSHSSTPETIRMIKSGAFEGLTISLSLLNALQMMPVLDSALENDVDIVVMNPLGGGVIPQNASYFEFAQAPGEDTVTAALRFAYAHPAVKVVLSGLSSLLELEQNLKAFTELSPEPDDVRLSRVTAGISCLSGYCTGCDYCANCPAGLPVSVIMKLRNDLLFDTIDHYNRKDPELLKNIKIFHAYRYGNRDPWLPEKSENPCTYCGQCEKKCTQHLEIIDSIDDFFNRAEKTGFSLAARKERLKELLIDKGYKRVGLYPNGGFADMIIKLYNRFWGSPHFEWVLFNSNPLLRGTEVGDMVIHGPDDISYLSPDIIIICTFRYDDSIYQDLQKYIKSGVNIVKLHKEHDVPWIF